jgi:hypothetical protein
MVSSSQHAEHHIASLPFERGLIPKRNERREVEGGGN